MWKDKEEQNAEEVVDAMIKFMEQTNEHLRMLKNLIDNQQIDIDNLRKKVNKVNEITPNRIIHLRR